LLESEADNVTDFGTLLRVFRLRSTDPLSGKPLSQQRLGGLLREELGVGFSGAAVSDWERGKSKLHADDRLTLVGLLGILHERGGIKDPLEANKLLEAGNYRALNPTETKRVFPEEPVETNANDPSPSHSSQKAPAFRPGNVFFGADDALIALLEKAKEGPPPAWPRLAAALLSALTDRLSARNFLRALIMVWVWLLTRAMIAPSLRWPFADQEDILSAAVLYAAGTLTLPTFIGLLAETKNNGFWQKHQLSNSLALRLYTHQGAFIGFQLGYYAVFLIALIRFYLHWPSTPWFELAAMLAPLYMGTMGARVVPYNLWRAFGRLNLRDGAIFFVFVFLGPFWGFFIVQYSSFITASAGVFMVLVSLTLLAGGMARRYKNKLQPPDF